MGRKLRNTIIILASPAALMATRGPQDYGIIMAFMAFVYSLPAGLITLCFIIYAAAKLKGGMRPGKNQGRIMLPLSAIFIVLSVLLALFWMGWAHWDGEMIKLMAGTFLPVLVLSVTAAVMARRLRNQAKQNGDTVG